MDRVTILKHLIDTHFGGSQAAFANAIGKSPAQVHHWLKGIRNIGDAVARQIELSLNLPEKYMWGECADIEKIDIKKQEERPKFMYDILDIPDMPTAPKIEDKYITLFALDLCSIQEITVLREWAVEQFGNNLSTIRVLTMNSDSMSGTIEDGSVLFVDESVKFYNGEGVYVIDTADGLKAKRLQMTVSGSLNVISDNPKYPIEVISPKDIDDIRICGKVKGCWQMKRL